jgi:hypothetical protein
MRSLKRSTPKVPLTQPRRGWRRRPGRGAWTRARSRRRSLPGISERESRQCSPSRGQCQGRTWSSTIGKRDAARPPRYFGLRDDRCRPSREAAGGDPRGSAGSGARLSGDVREAGGARCGRRTRRRMRATWSATIRGRQPEVRRDDRRNLGDRRRQGLVASPGPLPARRLHPATALWMRRRGPPEVKWTGWRLRVA